MRIRDWSSDVCSSDLEIFGMQRRVSGMSCVHRHYRPGSTAPLGYPCTGTDQVFRLALAVDGNEHMTPDGNIRQPAGSTLLAQIREIGSASCRERVCQYV